MSFATDLVKGAILVGAIWIVGNYLEPILAVLFLIWLVLFALYNDYL
jgi:hypothetical protein